jgi:DNA-binding LacI/PurR family transcriptional regulator
MKPITIRDVAKRAGVSHTTVSLVLNKSPKVKTETKEKVLKIIKQMDFYPSETARTLARGKSNSIAFISTTLVTPFISSILSSLEDKAFAEGRAVYDIEQHTTRGLESVKNEVLLKILYGRKASAIIMVSLKPDPELLLKFNDAGIPVILLENRMKGAHSVIVDNFKGAYTAVDYLAKKGKKKIGILAGIVGKTELEDLSPINTAIERFEGYKAALKDNGIKFDENLVAQINNYNEANAYKAFEELLKRSGTPDAIFSATGDHCAKGIMAVAEKKGIRIPDDMLLVGYDDVEIAMYLNPPLTTVRQPLREMGEAVFDLAMKSIKGELKEDTIISFTPELIKRKSA